MALQHGPSTAFADSGYHSRSSVTAAAAAAAAAAARERSASYGPALTSYDSADGYYYPNASSSTSYDYHQRNPSGFQRRQATAANFWSGAPATTDNISASDPYLRQSTTSYNQQHQQHYRSQSYYDNYNYYLGHNQPRYSANNKLGAGSACASDRAWPPNDYDQRPAAPRWRSAQALGADAYEDNEDNYDYQRPDYRYPGEWPNSDYRRQRQLPDSGDYNRQSSAAEYYLNPNDHNLRPASTSPYHHPRYAQQYQHQPQSYLDSDLEESTNYPPRPASVPPNTFSFYYNSYSNNNNNNNNNSAPAKSKMYGQQSTTSGGGGGGYYDGKNDIYGTTGQGYSGYGAGQGYGGGGGQYRAGTSQYGQNPATQSQYGTNLASQAQYAASAAQYGHVGQYGQAEADPYSTGQGGQYATAQGGQYAANPATTGQYGAAQGQYGSSGAALGGQYGTSTGAYGGANTAAPTAQHNHPPYYQQDGACAQANYDQQQQQQQNYANGYPPNMAAGGGSNYGDAYGQTYGYEQQNAMGKLSAITTTTATATAATPNTLNLNKMGANATAGKSPYGMSGPYGNDTSNTYLDYYRKLYYPYDPITGEYMKDSPNLDASMGVTMLPNVMPAGVGGDTMMAAAAAAQGGQMMNRGGGARYGTAANTATTTYGSQPYDLAATTGVGNMLATTGGGVGGGVGVGPVAGYNYPRFNENEDSLLLCCDFLIPRPSINCLIIALFAMLVLVIIFMVVKFTIMYPSDTINPDTVVLVDQVTVLLLFGALITLVWIFGIYFTSRRTRRQISNLLSCVSPASAGNRQAYQTTLGPDYDGYAGYGTGTIAPQQHQHSHGGGRAAQYNGNANGGTNYRYTNQYV